ncbi:MULTISPECIES: J domain-containing protein [Hyphobacterium]|uniref:J domain-containing protein n=1 Tax=Hyphobacterium vulgare TaxID=1736751 RepID=A0ABV6ZY50_9PROT
MHGTYKYRPRFRDIRIKPPKDKPEPEDRVCEWPGCLSRGDSRAPKGPDRLDDYHWFCQHHAGQYNKSWNFFAGMSEGEMKAFNKSAHYGHRPTWNFRGNTGAHAKSARASADFSKGFDDMLGLFGHRPANDRRNDEAPRRRFGRLQEMALETMNLTGDETKGAVKKRYAELVKRYHPDANGGDRSSEEQLGRVIHAYQILKSAGMA